MLQFEAGFLIVERGKLACGGWSGGRCSGGEKRFSCTGVGGGSEWRQAGSLSYVLDRGSPGGKLLVHLHAAWVGCEKPQQNVDAQDDCPGAAQEKSRAVPHVPHDDTQKRALV